MPPPPGFASARTSHVQRSPCPTECFVGPNGPNSAQSLWDSTNLQMREDGRFSLELWRFYESWGASSETQQENPQTRMLSNDSEEVRVTLQGTYSSNKEESLRLRGFQREGINQDFTEDRDCLVGGQPTWWSLDGLFFLYFAEEYSHWKVNAVRFAGGDGIKAVHVGARKSGSGYAHSGKVTSGTNFADVLARGSEWFEVEDDEWETLQVDARFVPARFVEFVAKEMVVEERHKHGLESSVDRHVDGEVSFRGWREGLAGGGVKLVLPPIPERRTVDSDDVVVPSKPCMQGGFNMLGDPDILNFRPVSKL